MQLPKLIRQVCLLLVLCLNSFASAQQVSVQMPSESGFVGVPMQLFVVFENVQDTVPPTLPNIDGFTIKRLAGEQSSSQTTIINGKVTSIASHLYTFILVPQRVGTITIPSLTFIVDEKAFQTTQKSINIKPLPTGDSLKVEVNATTEKHIYLGEPVDFTLHIFIEEFTDPNLDIAIDARAMFGILRPDSDFGIFTNAVQDQRVQFQNVQKTTDSNVTKTYFEYTTHATAWAESVGTLELSPVTVVADYPLSLARQHGFGLLGSNTLTMEQSHIISAVVEMPTIEVLPTPLEDRPDWFNGAVGTFDFDIVAEPTHVKVGEPITLTMRITYLTQGVVDLNYLAAPLLDRVPSLTNNFRVPDEPIGGSVSGRTKTFTQTIRPLHAGIVEIPPIPMSSFDPETDTYKTVWTKSIPIKVDPVATITASDLVGDNENGLQPNASKQPTKVEGGILANYTGDSLLQNQTISMTPKLIAYIVAPPLIFAFVICSMFFNKRKRTPASRRKGTIKQALATLHKADQLQGTQQATQGTQQATMVSNAIRSIQFDEKFATQANTLLKRCDASQFGGSEDQLLLHDAIVFVETLR